MIRMAKERKMDIQELMEWLQRETMQSVELRYAHQEWLVLVERGNHMEVVYGTVTDDPIKSLKIAKSRWESRSEKNPF